MHPSMDSSMLPAWANMHFVWNCISDVSSQSFLLDVFHCIFALLEWLNTVMTVRFNHGTHHRVSCLGQQVGLALSENATLAYNISPFVFFYPPLELQLEHTWKKSMRYIAAHILISHRLSKHGNHNNNRLHHNQMKPGKWPKAMILQLERSC